MRMTTEDPRILLFKGGKSLVSKAIMYFTDSVFTHTALYVRGATFESTVWQIPETWLFGRAWKPKWWMFWTWRSGIKITQGILEADETYHFRVPPTPMQNINMMNAAVDLVNERRMYNFLLTFFDMIIYPTRWFWHKIGWVPFSKRYLGENCSSFVDQVVTEGGGIDLWPKRESETTVPGDYPLNPNLVLEEKVLE
jgi:hypothetical protein